MKKQIAFKKIAKINLTAIVAGTGMGILLAFLGCGIWSLVVKSLATGVVQCGIYWLGNKWRPEWVFSWKSFTGLFRYGSFMFLNSIANSLYYSALSLIIGRCFSSVELGYYSQANKLQDVPRNSISSVVTNVTFPVFSNIQEDRAKLRNAFSKCIRSVAFIQFPIIMVLIITARPLVAVLFTDKWLPMVPYFQILAFAGLSSTLFEVHTNVIKSLGKSREVFILEFLLRIMGLTVVAISIRFGMIGLLAGYAFSQFLFYIAASAYVGKLIHYDICFRLRDLAPAFFIAVSAAALVYCFSALFDAGPVYLILIQASVYFVLYFSFSKMFGLQEFDFYFGRLKSIMKKHS